MSHQIARISRPGRRDYNEDQIIESKTSFDGKDLTLIAVADGMGGIAGGAEASSIASDYLAKEWDLFIQSEDWTGDIASVRHFLTQIYDIINQRIKKFGENQPQFKGMGTTLVVIVLYGEKALIANVGDSRAYMVHSREVHQITKDHAAAVENPFVSANPKKKVKPRFALTRCLDGTEKKPPDFFPVGEEWMQLPGDCFLFVCSDGLSGFVDDDQILNAFYGSVSVHDTVKTLYDQAYEKGGSDDNISIVISEVGNVDRKGRVKKPKAARGLQKATSSAMLVSLLSVLLLCLVGISVLSQTGSGYLFGGGASGDKPSSEESQVDPAVNQGSANSGTNFSDRINKIKEQQKKIEEQRYQEQLKFEQEERKRQEEQERLKELERQRDLTRKERERQQELARQQEKARQKELKRREEIERQQELRKQELARLQEEKRLEEELRQEEEARQQMEDIEKKLARQEEKARIEATHREEVKKEDKANAPEKIEKRIDLIDKINAKYHNLQNSSDWSLEVYSHDPSNCEGKLASDGRTLILIPHKDQSSATIEIRLKLFEDAKEDRYTIICAVEGQGRKNKRKLVVDRSITITKHTPGR